MNLVVHINISWAKVFQMYLVSEEQRNREAGVNREDGERGFAKTNEYSVREKSAKRRLLLDFLLSIIYNRYKYFHVLEVAIFKTVFYT